MDREDYPEEVNKALGHHEEEVYPEVGVSEVGVSEVEDSEVEDSEVEDSEVEGLVGHRVLVAYSYHHQVWE